MINKMSQVMALLGVIAAPAIAAADGAVVTHDELGAARASIEAKVAEARARDPQIFAIVRGAQTFRPEGYRKFRSQRPSAIGLVYRRMGVRAVWALVELAALDGPSTDGLNVAELRALRVGLLDAIGVAREAEAAPLMRAAMLRSTDLEVASAAAIGLGQLGDRELNVLLDHAHAGDPLLLAAVRGLGASRRPTAVARLGELLDTADAAAAATIVEALAEAGSSWAWETGKVGTAADGALVRHGAAAALARSYARLGTDESRATQIEAALGRVDAPETQGLLAAVSTSSPEAATRIEQLTKRLAARHR